VAQKTIGLVAPLPPQVGGVAGFAGWLLAHREEVGRRFDAFDLWRPADGDVGGRLSLRAVGIQARLLPRFLRWQRTAPNVVHYSVSHTATGLARDLVFLAALHASGRRVIGHLHVVPEGFNGRLRTLRALDRLVDAWVAIAPSSARALARHGVDAEWIPNPVAVSPNGHTSVTEDGPLRLLFVGRYGRAKGCLELVAALAAVRRSGTDATLRFVGSELREGEERTLRREVAAYGVEDAVEFAGVEARGELARSYSSAHALTLPSHSEGVPLVLLEAMSFGLPVIATPVGGIPDFVRNGEDGLLVPPGDVAALGDAIRALAGDSDLRVRLGESARRRVAREAGSETIVRRWREVYERLEARA